MAWLITLALFWGIGSFLCKQIDKKAFLKNTAQYEKDKEEKENYEFFFDTVYVMAWHYYQQLEPQVLKAWAEIPGGGPEYANIPLSTSMERFSEQIFGEAITHKSIKTVLQRRAELGWPIYIPTQAAQGSCRIDWVLSDSQWIDFDKTASALIPKIPNLGNFYQWQIALRVGRGSISEYIPSRGDARTFEYQAPWCFNGEIQWQVQYRSGTPENYSKTLCVPKKQYEIQR